MGALTGTLGQSINLALAAAHYAVGNVHLPMDDDPAEPRSLFPHPAVKSDPLPGSVGDILDLGDDLMIDGSHEQP